MEESTSIGYGATRIWDYDGNGVDDAVIGYPGDGSVAGAIVLALLHENGTAMDFLRFDGSSPGMVSLGASDYFGCSVACWRPSGVASDVACAVGAAGRHAGSISSGTVFFLRLDVDGSVAIYLELNENVLPEIGAYSYLGYRTCYLGLDPQNRRMVATSAWGMDSRAGAVFVLKWGLEETLEEYIVVRSSQISGDNANFGLGLSTFDMNSDGINDLIVGAPNLDSGTGSVTDCGGVVILLLEASGSVMDEWPAIDCSTGDLNGVFVRGDGLGYAVSPVGDLDGNQVVDLVASAPIRSVNGISRAGSLVLLLLEHDGSLKRHWEANVASLGITFEDSRIGTAIHNMGDFNADGFADLFVLRDSDQIMFIVMSVGGCGTCVEFATTPLGSLDKSECTCAPGYDGDGTTQCMEIDECAEYVHNCAPENTCVDTDGSFVCMCPENYYGHGDNFTDFIFETVEVSKDYGAGGFGFSVSQIGDFDGDGLVDLLVGDPYADSYKGAVHIILLNEDISVKDDIKFDSSTDGIPPLSDFDSFGTGSFCFPEGSFETVESDSVHICAVGAYGWDGNAANCGAIFMLRLTADTTSSLTYVKIDDEDVSLLKSNNYFGYRIVHLGDINGDGTPDLATSVWGRDSSSGGVVILRLNADTTTQSYTLLRPSTVQSLAGIKFGIGISSGDLNQDGWVDLVVGAPAYGAGINSQSGAVFLFFLEEDGAVQLEVGPFSSNSTSLDSLLGENDEFGFSVAIVDDSNRDGFPDVIISAPYGGYNGVQNTGVLYLLSFSGEGELKVVLQSNPSAFKENFTPGSLLGYSLNAVGDYNDDGVGDLFVYENGLETVFLALLRVPGCDACHELAHSPAGSFTRGDCECVTGYFGNGYDSCVEIDECTTMSHNCHVYAMCDNVDASFECQCREGYYGEGVADCTSCADDATSPLGSLFGSNCSCNAGFMGLGSESCSDVDECSLGAHVCSPVAVCTNSYGSFFCDCPVGYFGNGTVCTSCAEDPSSTDCRCVIVENNNPACSGSPNLLLSPPTKMATEDSSFAIFFTPSLPLSDSDAGASLSSVSASSVILNSLTFSPTNYLSEAVISPTTYTVTMASGFDSDREIYLSVTLPSQCDFDFFLSWQSHSVGSFFSHSESFPQALNVTIVSACDVPLLTLKNDLQTTEDKQVAVVLTPTLSVDTDLSESLRKVLISIPSNGLSFSSLNETVSALVSSGMFFTVDHIGRGFDSHNLLRSWSVSPPVSCDIDFSLTASTFAVEENNLGWARSVTATCGVQVTAEADLPGLLTGFRVTTMQDRMFPLVMTPTSSSDTDGSERFREISIGGAGGALYEGRSIRGVSTVYTVTSISGEFQAGTGTRTLSTSPPLHCEVDFFLWAHLFSVEENGKYVTASLPNYMQIIVTNEYEGFLATLHMPDEILVPDAFNATLTYFECACDDEDLIVEWSVWFEETDGGMSMLDYEESQFELVFPQGSVARVGRVVVEAVVCRVLTGYCRTLREATSTMSCLDVSVQTEEKVTKAKDVEVTAYIPVSCIVSSDSISYSWTLPLIESSANDLNLNGRILVIPSYLLSVGEKYEISVTVCSELTRDCATNSTAVYVTPTVPVAHISRGSGVHPRGIDLVVNASESYDVNGGDLIFRWNCAAVVNSPSPTTAVAYDTNVASTSFLSSTISAAEILGSPFESQGSLPECCAGAALMDDAAFVLPANCLDSGEYRITVIVAAVETSSNGAKVGSPLSANDTILISITDSKIPSVGIRGPVGLVAIEERILLEAESEPSESKLLEGAWSVYRISSNATLSRNVYSIHSEYVENLVVLPDSVVRTAVNNSQLALTEYALEENVVYIFRFVVTSWGESSTSPTTPFWRDYVLETAQQPSGGHVHVSPLEGTAMSTVFHISSCCWQVSGYQPLYRFSAICGETTTWLSDWQYMSLFSSTLPGCTDASVRVGVQMMSRHGARSNVVTSEEIHVTWPIKSFEESLLLVEETVLWHEGLSRASGDLNLAFCGMQESALYLNAIRTVFPDTWDAHVRTVLLQNFFQHSVTHVGEKGSLGSLKDRACSFVLTSTDNIDMIFDAAVPFSLNIISLVLHEALYYSEVSTNVTFPSHSDTRAVMHTIGTCAVALSRMESLLTDHIFLSSSLLATRIRRVSHLARLVSRVLVNDNVPGERASCVRATESNFEFGYLEDAHAIWEDSGVESFDSVEDDASLVIISRLHSVETEEWVAGEGFRHVIESCSEHAEGHLVSLPVTSVRDRLASFNVTLFLESVVLHRLSFSPENLTFDGTLHPSLEVRLLEENSGYEIPLHLLNESVDVHLEVNTTEITTGDLGFVQSIRNLSAICITLNERTGQWRADGCVSLPNPRPRGIEVSWVDGFEFSSDEEMSLSWEIDLGEACYENQPFLDTEGFFMRNFSSREGRRCPFVGQTRGCFWNWESQSFVGSECVWSSNLVCRCNHLGIFSHARGVRTHTPWNPPVVAELLYDSATVAFVRTCASLSFAFGLGVCMWHWVVVRRLRKEKMRQLLSLADYARLDDGTLIPLWSLTSVSPHDTPGETPFLSTSPNISRTMNSPMPSKPMQPVSKGSFASSRNCRLPISSGGICRDVSMSALVSPQLDRGKEVCDILNLSYARVLSLLPLMRGEGSEIFNECQRVIRSYGCEFVETSKPAAIMATWTGNLSSMITKSLPDVVPKISAWLQRDYYDTAPSEILSPTGSNSHFDSIPHSSTSHSRDMKGVHALQDSSDVVSALSPSQSHQSERDLVSIHPSFSEENTQGPSKGPWEDTILQPTDATICNRGSYFYGTAIVLARAVSLGIFDHAYGRDLLLGATALFTGGFQKHRAFSGNRTPTLSSPVVSRTSERLDHIRGSPLHSESIGHPQSPIPRAPSTLQSPQATSVAPHSLTPTSPCVPSSVVGSPTPSYHPLDEPCFRSWDHTPQSSEIQISLLSPQSSEVTMFEKSRNPQTALGPRPEKPLLSVVPPSKSHTHSLPSEKCEDCPFGPHFPSEPPALKTSHSLHIRSPPLEHRYHLVDQTQYQQQQSHHLHQRYNLHLDANYHDEGTQQHHHRSRSLGSGFLSPSSKPPALTPSLSPALHRSRKSTHTRGNQTRSPVTTKSLPLTPTHITTPAASTRGDQFSPNFVESHSFTSFGSFHPDRSISSIYSNRRSQASSLAQAGASRGRKGYGAHRGAGEMNKCHVSFSDFLHGGESFSDVSASDGGPCGLLCEGSDGESLHFGLCVDWLMPVMFGIIGRSEWNLFTKSWLLVLLQTSDGFWDFSEDIINVFDIPRSLFQNQSLLEPLSPQLRSLKEDAGWLGRTKYAIMRCCPSAVAEMTLAYGRAHNNQQQQHVTLLRHVWITALACAHLERSCWTFRIQRFPYVVSSSEHGRVWLRETLGSDVVVMAAARKQILEWQAVRAVENAAPRHFIPTDIIHSTSLMELWRRLWSFVRRHHILGDLFQRPVDRAVPLEITLHSCFVGFICVVVSFTVFFAREAVACCDTMEAAFCEDENEDTPCTVDTGEVSCEELLSSFDPFLYCEETVEWEFGWIAVFCLTTAVVGLVGRVLALVVLRGCGGHDLPLWRITLRPLFRLFPVEDKEVTLDPRERTHAEFQSSLSQRLFSGRSLLFISSCTIWALSGIALAIVIVYSPHAAIYTGRKGAMLLGMSLAGSLLLGWRIPASSVYTWVYQWLMLDTQIWDDCDSDAE